MSCCASSRSGRRRSSRRTTRTVHGPGHLGSSRWTIWERVRDPVPAPSATTVRSLPCVSPGAAPPPPLPDVPAGALPGQLLHQPLDEPRQAHRSRPRAGPVGGPARPLPRARPHRRGAGATPRIPRHGLRRQRRHRRGRAGARRPVRLRRAARRGRGARPVVPRSRLRRRPRTAERQRGRGDFAVTASWLLAGRGFRSSPLSHAEAQEYFARPVLGLDLVDPRYYHLDTALCVLDAGSGEPGGGAAEVMYYPGAFSAGVAPCWPGCSPTR